MKREANSLHEIKKLEQELKELEAIANKYKPEPEAEETILSGLNDTLYNLYLGFGLQVHEKDKTLSPAEKERFDALNNVRDARFKLESERNRLDEIRRDINSVIPELAPIVVLS